MITFLFKHLVNGAKDEFENILREFSMLFPDDNVITGIATMPASFGL